MKMKVGIRCFSFPLTLFFFAYTSKMRLFLENIDKHKEETKPPREASLTPL